MVVSIGRSQGSDVDRDEFQVEQQLPSCAIRSLPVSARIASNLKRRLRASMVLTLGMEERQEVKMAKPIPHPKLSQRSERFGSGASAIVVSGFIAPSSDETVRVCPALSGGEYLEIPEGAVLDFEQDMESGVTKLFIDPSAVVTVGFSQKRPVISLAMQQRLPPFPTGQKTCVQAYIDSCKSDPTVSNKAYCDSPEALAAGIS